MNAYKEFQNFNAIAFKVGDQNYIYDSFSNRIVRVDKIVIDIIDDTFKFQKDEIIRKYRDIYKTSLISKAFDNIVEAREKSNIFLHFTLPSLSISSNVNTLEKVKEKVSNNLNKLILNVTENCNYRCEYCIYSGCYENRRIHNKLNDLSWDIGRRAIDFFIDNSNSSDERFISFYGGEVLIRFNYFIKKAIKYAQKKDPEIKFSLTTNGSLLNKEILEYFAEYDVSLTISLDGPKELNDRYRRFKNNKPTFENIVEKLRLIKNKFPDYYSNKIRINAVLIPHHDYEVLNKFFAGDSIFSFLKDETKFSVGVVNPDKNDFVKKYKYDDFFYKFLVKMFEIYRHYHINSLPLSEIPVTRSLLSRNIKLIHFRDNKPLNEYSYYWPNGVCIPGMRTLFVSHDGSLYPCEKLYDFGRMCIGDVFNGFDYKRIADFIDKYCETTIPACKDCWNFRLCSLCFIDLCDQKSDTFNLRNRVNYCEALKYITSLYLKYYISIRDIKDNAFDYLLDGEDLKPKYVDKMLED
jgi:uncharacterized protein